MGGAPMDAEGGGRCFLICGRGPKLGGGEGVVAEGRGACGCWGGSRIGGGSIGGGLQKWVL